GFAVAIVFVLCRKAMVLHDCRDRRPDFRASRSAACARGSATGMTDASSSRESLRVRLATQLDSLPFLLAGASGAALKQRSPSGKWSAHENLAHLVCHHAGTIQRIERILREDRPALPSYRAETDPDWPAT